MGCHSHPELLPVGLEVPRDLGLQGCHLTGNIAEVRLLAMGLHCSDDLEHSQQRTGVHFYQGT